MVRLCLFLLFGIGFLILSCQNTLEYYSLPTYSDSGLLQAVIEIPAGSSVKYEFNKESNSFEIDQIDGKDRVIEFLPYLGNYGFIPSTLSKENQGGDGDALDVLVLSETIPTGSLTEIIPLGVLKLIDDGELDYKIIANVHDPQKRIIKAANFQELNTRYPSIVEIIELWFLNYNPKDSSSIEGWGNEEEAIKAVQNNLLK